MAQASLRSDFRVGVPGEYIREVALWACKPLEYLRLDVSALGRPHLRYTLLGPERMGVTDLSIRGMGLRLTLPDRILARVQSIQTVFAYFQLWDPSVDDPHGLLTIFTYCMVKRVAPSPDGVLLGITFSRFAVGSRHEKALEFLDAERFGVTELASWCDKVSRGLSFRGDPDYPGLSLENLLAEVEEAHSKAPTSQRENA